MLNFYRRSQRIDNIQDITQQNLHEFFIHGRTQRNWTPRTFIRYYQILTVFFRWCVANHYMEQSPLTEMELRE